MTRPTPRSVRAPGRDLLPPLRQLRDGDDGMSTVEYSTDG
jgi:hypothetical protein